MASLKNVMTVVLVFAGWAGTVHAEKGTPMVNVRCVQPSLQLQYRVDYANTNLGWGTRVFVHYAEKRETYEDGGFHRVENWINPRVIEAVASGPFAWSAVPENIYGPLEFVFEIIRPDGSSTFDNGSGSSFGRYEVNLDPYLSGALDCGQPGSSEFRPAYVGIVR